MKYFLFPFIIATVFSCTHKEKGPGAIARRADAHWLDSVINASDSSYSKPYKRTDFVTASYYVNKKDSSVCEVMKDSVDTIRQIILAKKNIRTYFAQFYSNGQLQAQLPLDEFGQYHGAGIYYYENGVMQSSGHFEHGMKTGSWVNYNDKGKLLSIDQYNNTGQRTSNRESELMLT